MAITARRVTERVAVGIFITVAIDTARVDGFVQTVRMTIGTVNTTMFAFQGKYAHTVVVKHKVSTRPTGFRMTSVTRKSCELTTMAVLVTATTVSAGRLPIVPIVTVHTFVLGVLTP